MAASMPVALPSLIIRAIVRNLLLVVAILPAQFVRTRPSNDELAQEVIAP